jgi:hypothetical protein
MYKAGSAVIIIIKSLLNRKEAQQTCAFTIPVS